jgi:GcrA cell cycle regulator
LSPARPWFAEIAEQMRMTRNVVVGRVHRLQQQGMMPDRGPPPASVQPERRHPPPRRHPLPAPLPVAAAAVIAAPPPAPRPAIVIETRPPLPVLAPGACQWPIGDTRSASFRYCGAPAIARPGRTALLYCAAHGGLAYVTRTGGVRAGDETTWGAP